MDEDNSLSEVEELVSKWPPSFKEVKISFEVNLLDFGGVIRFQTVKELIDWLNEEEVFWSWLDDKETTEQVSRQGDLCRDSQELLDAWVQDYGSSLDKPFIVYADTEDDDGNPIVLKEERDKEIAEGIVQFVEDVRGVFLREIVEDKNHLIRFLPEAKFIEQLAKDNHHIAVYALDHIIQHQLDNIDRDAKFDEFFGRMLATLFVKKVNMDVKHDIEGFKVANRKWDQELGVYRERYDVLENNFSGVQENIRNEQKEWSENCMKMKGQFIDFMKNEENELSSLKEAYDTHMMLKAPVDYWRQKKIKHGKKIEILKWWSIGGAVLVCILLLSVAHTLPSASSSDQIPFRKIGLFFVISTFLFWVIRLIVKLLLSNIHLQADAEEREVMTSTFLALIKDRGADNGLKQEDVALVLAPLFRPSTTGVIKEDGNTSFIGDLISRVAKK